MPKVDWDMTGALDFLTVNDTGDDNIFGETCLERPATISAVNLAHVLDSNIAQVDTYQEMDWYIKTGFNRTLTDIMMGARIDTASGNDGYFAGYRVASATATLDIIKRVSSVITLLKQSALNPSTILTNATLYKMILIVKGIELEVRIHNASGATKDAIYVSDASLSNVGTCGLIAIDGGGRAVTRMDNYEVNDVA